MDRSQFAERNARKKKLIINTLAFELHTAVFNEFGDELPVNQRFTADRVSRILTMTDFDAGGAAQSVELDGGKMSILLRWIVHSLEIFMWPEDYGLEPEVWPTPDPDDWDDEYEEDFLVQEAAPPEPEGEASWRIQIEYADPTAQEIVSYGDYLGDRPEELYLALLEYFEPETEDFGEDDSLL